MRIEIGFGLHEKKQKLIYFWENEDDGSFLQTLYYAYFDYLTPVNVYRLKSIKERDWVPIL
jgi:hypothetical protein